MSTDLGKPIKEQILVNLQALKTAGNINSIASVDKSVNPLDTVPDNGYPLAIVAMPKITADYEDQATNKRTYTFNILFVLEPATLTNADTDVEHLIDAVLNQFDNNFTLAGAAVGSVLPIEIVGEPVSTGAKELLCFVATIRAQALYSWSNS